MQKEMFGLCEYMDLGLGALKFAALVVGVGKVIQDGRLYEWMGGRDCEFVIIDQSYQQFCFLCA